MNIPEVLDVNLPPGSVEKAATQVGVQLDHESLKLLEQEMSARNDKVSKKMKEIEMMRHNVSDIPPLPSKKFSQPFQEKQSNENVMPLKPFNDENFIKHPSAKIQKGIKCENSNTI